MALLPLTAGRQQFLVLMLAVEAGKCWRKLLLLFRRPLCPTLAYAAACSNMSNPSIGRI